jgi:hypothetical protein
VSTWELPAFSGRGKVQDIPVSLTVKSMHKLNLRTWGSADLSGYANHPPSRDAKYTAINKWFSQLKQRQRFNRHKCRAQYNPNLTGGIHGMQRSTEWKTDWKSAQNGHT